ncbi:MAG: DUF523 domain-containing protein [Desulfuromonas sp.]|uniref:DUF523 domain-containing protein n=1 Tax=Desulfuromonas sp. TaxID=892 RepID=UPI000CC7A3DD|nr:DUF523 domain-containing protein [Desulfuromonas sp.]PLX84704.1 MAG: DUF523 domain-containing protein [Desulfuromonas sp.]
MPRPILVSACLLGLQTRYDGAAKRNAAVLRYLADRNLTPVPVCPEQLAGLATPRPATRFTSGDGTGVLNGTGTVKNSEGKIVNDAFLRGASETLEVARLSGCTEALLKERSPSCGVHQVYLEETIVPGQGVACALLSRRGFQVRSEEDL